MNSGCQKAECVIVWLSNFKAVHCIFGFFPPIYRDSWLNVDVKRQSVCELEVDVVAADILNRLEVGDNIGGNPGLAALWDDEKHRRQDRGMSLDISPPSSPGITLAYCYRRTHSHIYVDYKISFCYIAISRTLMVML